VYKSLDEALSAKLDLVERIQSIDVQLAERGAKFAVGRHPDQEYKEYLEWKARALRSKSSMMSRLSRTKREIQDLRKAAFNERLKNRNGADGLLKDLYKLTRTLIAEGADITSDEQLLLDDVQQYIAE